MTAETSMLFIEKRNNIVTRKGAFSEVILLPGESRKEFEALLDALIDEWDPQGPTQMDKIFNIARNLWLKRRLGSYLKDRLKEAWRVTKWEEFNFERYMKFKE